jgi:hypothetical protein
MCCIKCLDLFQVTQSIPWEHLKLLIRYRTIFYKRIPYIIVCSSSMWLLVLSVVPFDHLNALIQSLIIGYCSPYLRIQLLCVHRLIMMLRGVIVIYFSFFYSRSQRQPSCFSFPYNQRCIRSGVVMLGTTSAINDEELRLLMLNEGAPSWLRLLLVHTWLHLGAYTPQCRGLGTVHVTLDLLKGCLYHPRCQTCYRSLHIAIRTLIL